MNEQNPEQLPNEATRLYFPPEIAPFGELNLIRIDHTRSSTERDRTTYDTTLEVSAGSILRQAWVDSDWLPQAVGPRRAQVFEKEFYSGQVPKALAHSVIAAVFRPRETTAWFAVRPPKSEHVYEVIKGLGAPYFIPSQVVGFGNAKNDVSGNFWQQMIKRRRHPEKIYAAVSNVNVRPDEQSRYIGTALFHTCLGMFTAEQVPTTYVAASNGSLMQQLGELGYRSTGSQSRTDLVSNAVVKEVRLQADSVGAVRNRLAEEFPWLSQAEAIPKGWLDNRY